MILIKSTKLYWLFAISLTLLVSCGSSDPTPPEPPKPPIEVTNESLKGSWEMYYFLKEYHTTGNVKIDRELRYTEQDGFTVTFEPYSSSAPDGLDGKFYEHNVFDMQILGGKYKLIKKINAQELDTIRFEFKSLYTGDDTITKASIPTLYEDRFIYLAKYNGDVEGSGHFNVQDLKYYRHTVRGPNYEPPAGTLKQKYASVDESKLLGTWELYKQLDKTHDAEAYEVIKHYGSRFTFSIVNGKRIFREEAKFNGAAVTPIDGIFKIVDDVIHMYAEKVPVTNDKGETTYEPKSFKFWIQQFSETGTTMMKDGDEWASTKNALYTMKTEGYYKKVAATKAASNFNFSRTENTVSNSQSVPYYRSRVR